MDQLEAIFYVESALRKANCVWAENEIRFFGRLSVGTLSIDDTIRIPIVSGGFVEARIARFTEDLSDDWLGLPFYNTIQAEPDPFCICVDGTPIGQRLIAVPSQIEKYASRLVISVDDCIEYFKAIISDPKKTEPWSQWWVKNIEVVRSHFPRDEYLRLKFRKLQAVRQILFDRGLLPEDQLEYRSPRFEDTHCFFCGHELFWAIPGSTTVDDIVAFARMTGDEHMRQERWIHPGVYCPNGCVFVMHNFGRSTS